MKRFLLIFTLVCSLLNTSVYALELNPDINLTNPKATLERMESNIDQLLDRAINISMQVNSTDPGEYTEQAKKLKDQVKFYESQIVDLRNNLNKWHQQTENYSDKSKIFSLILTTDAYLATIDNLTAFLDSKGSNDKLRAAIEYKYIGDANFKKYK